MQIEEFALATWLNQYETDVEFNLAASTGPLWTVAELLALEGRTAGELSATPLNYVHAAGTAELRSAIAAFYGNVDPEWVQVTTGSAEALWMLLFHECQPGANIIVPRPCYPAFDGIPRALGAEVRYWHFRPENAFRPDLDELKRLIDRGTRAIVINSPHNPTGVVLEPEQVRAIAELAAARGVRVISDEVYHGVYYDGTERASAAGLPSVVVTGDISKAFSLAGLRIGWVVERDPARRHALYNLRSYICVSGNVLAERLGALALRQHRTILGRNRAQAAANLELLAHLFDEHAGRIGWVRPRGGFTCFPWLRDEADAGPLCRALVEQAGVLFAPGATFGMPAHFRVGFGVAGARFPQALERVRAFLAARRPASAGSPPHRGSPGADRGPENPPSPDSDQSALRTPHSAIRGGAQ